MASVDAVEVPERHDGAAPFGGRSAGAAKDLGHGVPGRGLGVRLSRGFRLRPVPLAVALCLGIATPAWAAWPFGGGAITRIPVPAREFSGELVDVGGTRVALSRLSLDGEVFVYGDLGRGQLSVPFEEVRSVAVGPAQDDEHRTLRVVTRAGAEVALVVEDDLPWFGRTPWGNYRIEVRDLAEVHVDELRR